MRRDFSRVSQRSTQRIVRFGMLLALMVWMAAGTVWIVTAGGGGEFAIGVGKEPDIVTDEVGNAVVVWEDTHSVKGKHFDPTGLPSTEFTIAGGGHWSGVSFESPGVTYLPSGEFFVTWEHQDGANSQVMAQQFSSMGIPFGVQFLVSSAGRHPAIGADDSGQVVLAWCADSETADENQFIVRILGSMGIPFGVEFQVGRGAAHKPALAVKPNGDFMVAWEDSDGDIQGQVFDSTGTPIHAAFRVNKAKPGRDTDPDLTVALDGDFTIVWEKRFEGSDQRHVWARRISSSMGIPFGVNFQVTRKPVMNDTQPSVAADERGNTLVAWRQFDHDTQGIAVRQLDLTARPTGGLLYVSESDAVESPVLSTGNDSTDFFLVWQSEGEILGRYIQVPLDDN